MKLTPWLVILSLSLVACSGSKSAQKVNEEPPQIELSDADEFIENPSDAPVDSASLAQTNEAVTEATTNELTPVETTPAPVDQTVTEAPVVDEMSPIVESKSEATPEISTTSSVAAGTMQEYKVQKNETLMMIAFKLYGDYAKWKTLAAQNQKALKGGQMVREGMTLQYSAPAQEFVWNPQGLPYLIRTGDTLGGISKTVYTTSKKWKLIWNNNKPLIKDPNLIFSGFTIYYLENGREVASDI
jgi:nucleoid-associated protein YgaU